MATNCIAILVAKYRIAGMTWDGRGDDIPFVMSVVILEPHRDDRMTL